MKKTYLKFLAIGLAVVLVCALLPQLDLMTVATAETAAQPDRVPDPGPLLQESDEDLPPIDLSHMQCGTNLWAKLEDGTLTITGSGDMYASCIYANDWPWYRVRYQIDSISMPEGQTDVGRCAFRGSTAAKVTVPSTLTRIRQQAFAYTDLTKVELPAGLKRIDLDAFYGSELKELVLRNPECLVRVMTDQYYDESEEDLYTTVEDCTLGNPNNTVIYGKHIPGGDNAPLVQENSEYYTYPERYAKLCGYAFYPINAFSDVAEYSFYEIPVAWANGKKITTGVGGGKFAPDVNCTRSQVVTFLWRAHGEPEPVSTSNPFTDVAEDSFYFKAMLWARENGITNGTSATTFSPDKVCTRSEVVTFLWRAHGEPEPATTSNPFTDAAEGSFYYKAMLWAVENGITNGTGGTSFSPGLNCTRSQVVTFLYRADSVPVAFNELGDQFLLYVEDVYTVTGRGTVVTGRVQNGRVNTGDSIKIMTYDSDNNPVVLTATVEAIEMFHKIMDYAEKGDNVGILLSSNVARTDVQRGAALVSATSRLQFSQSKAMIGTLDLNGSATGSGVDLSNTYQFKDAATDYTCQFLSLAGSSPMPMGAVRSGVKVAEQAHPVVWYKGQVLTVALGGKIYGTFTIESFEDLP